MEKQLSASAVVIGVALKLFKRSRDLYDDLRDSASLGRQQFLALPIGQEVLPSTLRSATWKFGDAAIAESP